MVFLHGHWLTRRWTPFHQALAESVDLLAPELPGFGETPLPPEVTGRGDVLLLVRDLLDRLDLDQVHLAGYGLGGWIAADLAVWFPTRVRSLSLLAPFGLRVPGHPLVDVFVLNPATYADMYFEGDDADHTDLVPGAGTPDQGGAEEFAHRYGEMGAAARLMWQRRYDTKLDARLPRLDVPALVVGAPGDRIVPTAHIDRWTALLRARQLRLDGGGHAFPVQRPEAAARAVGDFVQEVVAR